MSARWEPLETAEEVVAAHAAGRHVEIETKRLGNPDWERIEKTEPLDVYYVETDMFAGWKFRALIEDSK